jgi:hypothetical protein
MLLELGGKQTELAVMALPLMVIIIIWILGNSSLVSFTSAIIGSIQFDRK